MIGKYSLSSVPEMNGKSCLFPAPSSDHGCGELQFVAGEASFQIRL